MSPAAPQPLLRVTGLRVTYRGATAPVEAVRGIGFEVHRGEIVALVGESGSGKSTTAHAVLRLLGAGGRISGGRIDFAGQDLAALPDRELRRVRGAGIALVPQDPSAFLNPLKRAGEQVAEVLRIHRMARGRQAGRQAVELLEQAGLSDPARRARQYPHELSGGMRQRVLIAIALAGQPSLIVADEPTSALDVTVQRRILDHLGELTQRLRIAMLLITHDLGVAAERADRVLVMRGGEIVESGPAEVVLQSPRHEYTRSLLDAVPAFTERPAIEVHRQRHAVRPAPARPALLVVDRVSRVFPGQAGALPAVDDVSFTMAAGETLGLVGESGAGKSTIARLAACLDRPTAGTVRVDGMDTTALSTATARRLRRRVQLIQQSPFASLDPRWSVQRSVAEPLRALGIGDRRERSRRVRELFDAVGLSAALQRRRPAELSGGQRQRVAIARALAPAPALVICDEPMSALDVSVQSQVLDLLAALQAELGLSYLFVSHDLAVVRQLCDRIAVLRGGRIVETGPAPDLFSAPAHPYTQELLAAVPGRSRRPPAALHPAS